MLAPARIIWIALLAGYGLIGCLTADDGRSLPGGGGASTGFGGAGSGAASAGGNAAGGGVRIDGGGGGFPAAGGNASGGGSSPVPSGGATGCSLPNGLACGTDANGVQTACTGGLVCCYAAGANGSMCGATSTCVAPSAPSAGYGRCSAGHVELCKYDGDCASGYHCSGPANGFCVPNPAGAGGAPGSGGGSSSGGVAADAGAGGSPVDRCATVTQLGEWGIWCGANLGGGADVQRLYYCSDGKTAMSVVCQEGCHASAPGQPDYCNGLDPCMSSPYDGDVCGQNLGPNAETNTLYTCSGQATAATTVCSSGCVAAPPGQPDHCG